MCGCVRATCVRKGRRGGLNAEAYVGGEGQEAFIHVNGPMIDKAGRPHQAGAGP